MLRRTKPITISILPEFLEEINELAEEEKRTRSELLREAVRQYVKNKRWEKIREQEAQKSFEQEAQTVKKEDKSLPEENL